MCLFNYGPFFMLSLCSFNKIKTKRKEANEVIILGSIEVQKIIYTSFFIHISSDVRRFQSGKFKDYISFVFGIITILCSDTQAFRPLLLFLFSFLFALYFYVLNCICFKFITFVVPPIIFLSFSFPFFFSWICI